MLTTADLGTIARRHGLEMSQVRPDSLDQRLEKLRHCLSNRDVPDPINPDLLRLAATDYLIIEFQKTYFVTEHFDLLESLTPERFVATAKLAAKLPPYNLR